MRNKASEITKFSFDIFIEIVCFFASFICLLKILNQKATVSKGTIGFDV